MRPLRIYHPSMNIGQVNDVDRRYLRSPPFGLVSRLGADGLRIPAPGTLFRQLKAVFI
jgi:hypothetical protein